MGNLTALSAKTLSRHGRHGDGDGLYFYISRSGAKSWVQRIVVDGRRRDIGLGAYPDVSLAGARSIAHDNRAAVAEGRDPVSEKRVAREASRKQTPSIPTFAEACSHVIELRRPTWSNAKHADQWKNTLATYAHPLIGSKPVDEISSADVLAVLTPIWTVKSETASRVRQRMETIFDWAIAQGWRLDNPAGRSILKVLPKLPKVKKHHPALPYAEVPAALEQIRESTADLVTKLSFEFLMLTAARSGEVRLADWSEIDWESRTWTIPAIRMKARREHRVPLTGRALEVLSESRTLYAEDSMFVFPAHSGRPLSNMVYVSLLRRLGIPAVAHGFRSSFKDWCIECTDTPWVVGEAALAHNLGNSTETAYARSDLFERRRGLMEAWTDFLACSGGLGNRISVAVRAP